MEFEDFVRKHESRLRAGLIAAYGPVLGADCVAEAMAFGWENWSKLKVMENPSGYLYKVGRTAARRHMRPSGFLPDRPLDGLPDFEPELVPALERLTEQQRVAVVLVHGLGWSLTDAAEVLDVSVSTLRTHIQRAMTKLRTSLKVDYHAS